MSDQRKCINTYLKDGTLQSLMLYGAEGGAAALALNFLFYREWMTLPLMLLVVEPLFILSMLKDRQEALRTQEIREFREALDALSLSLRAGYSVENAIWETADIPRKTLGKKSQMTRAWQSMADQLKLRIPADRLISEFAADAHSEEIHSFAEVFLAGRHLGGNLSELVSKSADTISRKLEVEAEIRTVLAAKKLEQRVMAVMPLGIILYMNVTSSGYLDVLYHNLLGQGVMTVCLIGWAVTLYWGRRIVAIEI